MFFAWLNVRLCVCITCYLVNFCVILLQFFLFFFSFFFNFFFSSRKLCTWWTISSRIFCLQLRTVGFFFLHFFFEFPRRNCSSRWTGTIWIIKMNSDVTSYVLDLYCILWYCYFLTWYQSVWTNWKQKLSSRDACSSFFSFFFAFYCPQVFAMMQ